MSATARLADHDDDLAVYETLWQEQEASGDGDLSIVGIELIRPGSDRLEGHLTPDALRQLDPFAMTESGGTLAIWTPSEDVRFVVYLCDENMSDAVVARTLRQFAAVAAAFPSAFVYSQVSLEEVEASGDLADGYADQIRSLQSWVLAALNEQPPVTASVIMDPLAAEAPDFPNWLRTQYDRFYEMQTAPQPAVQRTSWWRRLFGSK